MDEKEVILRQQIQEDFSKWRADKERNIEREFANKSFVQAWANVAYLAEYQRDSMGRELNKLQNRIGRQRVANSKLIWRIKELELKNRKLQEKLREKENI